MKRIALGCFYDEDGIIGEYFYHLVNSIRSLCDKIIIISNSKILDDYEIRLKETVDEIVFREDRGRDAGAFREYILKKDNEYWKDWDEVVIFNDSIFGPFCDWRETFDRMDAAEYDVWAIQDMAVKYRDILYHTITPHFVVFRSKVLKVGTFVDFWHILHIADKQTTTHEDVLAYEHGMITHFEKRGFLVGSLRMAVTREKYMGVDGMGHMREHMEKFHYPVLKWRSFSVAYYREMLEAIEYINEKTEYDYNIIKKHLMRMEEKGEMHPFTFKAINDFLDTYKTPYVFGNGVIGKRIQEYLLMKGYPVKGIVVSNPNSKEEICVSDLDVTENDGIIVAVGGLVKREEIEAKLTGIFKMEQMLFPLRI